MGRQGLKNTIFSHGFPAFQAYRQPHPLFPAVSRIIKHGCIYLPASVRRKGRVEMAPVEIRNRFKAGGIAESLKYQGPIVLFYI